MLKKLILILMASIMPLTAQAWQARVVKAVDGDTVHVEPAQGGDRVKIRLYGIDAPEKDQPYGSIAAGYVSDSLLWKQVEIEEYEMDRYGRVVAEILLPDGTSFNRELIAKGLAWRFDKYCTESFCSEWKQVENEAREAKRGLWKDENAVAPWDWRRLNK